MPMPSSTRSPLICGLTTWSPFSPMADSAASMRSYPNACARSEQKPNRRRSKGISYQVQKQVRIRARLQACRKIALISPRFQALDFEIEFDHGLISVSHHSHAVLLDRKSTRL